MHRCLILCSLCLVSCAAPVIENPQKRGNHGRNQSSDLPVADRPVVPTPKRDQPDIRGTCEGARDRILRAARNLVGVRESGGNNRGPEVDKIIRNGGWDPVESPSWCGLANRYVYDIAEEKDKGPQGRGSAWSPNWVQNPTWTQTGKGETPLPGDAWGIAWRGDDGVYRVRHTGLVESWGLTSVNTLEGNTTVAGTADSLKGDSYMARKRPVRSITYAKNWLN